MEHFDKKEPESKVSLFNKCLRGYFPILDNLITKPIRENGLFLRKIFLKVEKTRYYAKKWYKAKKNSHSIYLFFNLQGNNGVVHPKTLEDTDDKFQSHVQIQINQSPSPQIQQQEQKIQSNPAFSDGDFEFVSRTF